MSVSEASYAAKMEWTDMIKAGIIDAAKVTRSALQNAASVAAIRSRAALPKFVTLGNGERFKVTVWNGVETIKPQGSELYSDGKYCILFGAVDQLDRQNRGS